MVSVPSTPGILPPLLDSLRYGLFSLLLHIMAGGMSLAGSLPLDQKAGDHHVLILIRSDADELLRLEAVPGVRVGRGPCQIV